MITDKKMIGYKKLIIARQYEQTFMRNTSVYETPSFIKNL